VLYAIRDELVNFKVKIHKTFTGFYVKKAGSCLGPGKSISYPTYDEMLRFLLDSNPQH
jgi:hypothetical protein